MPFASGGSCLPAFCRMLMPRGPARRLTADPNRLLALPYRLGVFLHSAWLLAAYTQLKNRFL